MAKSVYKNPTAGTPLISTISTGCKTPILKIKFCNLLRPFYYPNSPTIPRYSVTCIIDAEEHKEFLKNIQSIEKNESVETIIKNETEKLEGEYFNTGKLLIKMQGKDKIPVYLDKGGGKKEEVELEDELAKGEDVVVFYDILRYTKKNTTKAEHGLNFKPTSIFYYPKE